MNDRYRELSTAIQFGESLLKEAQQKVNEARQELTRLYTERTRVETEFRNEHHESVFNYGMIVLASGAKLIDGVITRIIGDDRDSIKFTLSTDDSMLRIETDRETTFMRTDTLFIGNPDLAVRCTTTRTDLELLVAELTKR